MSASLRAFPELFNAMGDSLQNRLPDPAFPASRSGMEWSDVIGESDPFGNGGGAGKTLRAIEWGRHRMGSPAAWPQSLCTILTLCLASPEPICILWGPARVCFYNDACISIIGEKHPWALGKTGAEIWPGLWEKAIQPLCDAVERNGKAVSSLYSN